jgi:hypothetical protein
VDGRLEGMPSYPEVPSTDLMIEWVYAIDLDREIVQIRSHSAESSFRLSSGTRPLQLAEDLKKEEEDEDDEGDGEDDEQGEGEDQESKEHTKVK